MVLSDDDESDADEIHLTTHASFTEIMRDVNGRNAVYCSSADENFSAGESVELDPPIPIPIRGGAHHYYSHVGAILRVDQQSATQRVFLSLFIKVTDEMGINHQPPAHRNYIQYSEHQLIWSKYQCWVPTTRIRREAFVFSPFEVNSGLNDAQVSLGMTNAYCIVAKWNSTYGRGPRPSQWFQLIGHDLQNIPGTMHLIDLGCVTHRYWTFRSTVASKIIDVLSKPSLVTRTNESIRLDGISEFDWHNFRRRTIPLEDVERTGIITKRAIRKTLTIEVLRGTTTKHLARFDTTERLDLLKDYFGASILGAARIRRFAGPSFSRREGGPNPAFKARRLNNEDSVGAFLGLPITPTTKYHSTKPGIDVLYIPAKRQLSIRMRFVTASATDPVVLQQFLRLPHQPAANADDIPELVPNKTDFEHQGLMFIVRAVLVDGTVVCEVTETTNDGLHVGEEIIMPFQSVVEYVNSYNYMESSDDE